MESMTSSNSKSRNSIIVSKMLAVSGPLSLNLLQRTISGRRQHCDKPDIRQRARSHSAGVYAQYTPD
eukprot:4392-Heterococcus_DN1.PRE.3